MTRYGNTWSSSNPGHSLNRRPEIVNVINGEKRYYSALDAELFFGNIFIDDVVDISWAMQQQTLPIFGYNSYAFDDIATGSRMVQGQFTMNFHERGYLENLQKDTEFISIARQMYGMEHEKQSDFTSDFRKRLNLPIWDKGFDIVIAFGSHGEKTSTLSDGKIATFIVLECVQITGSQSMLSSDGSSVIEVYTFTARDIRHVHEEERSEVDLDSDEGDIIDNTIISRIETVDGHAVFKYTLENKIDASKNSTMKMTDVFSNKELNAEFKLESDIESNTFSYTLSKELTKVLFREMSDNDDVLVTVNLYYITNNESKKYENLQIIIEME